MGGNLINWGNLYNIHVQCTYFVKGKFVCGVGTKSFRWGNIVNIEGILVRGTKELLKFSSFVLLEIKG